MAGPYDLSSGCNGFTALALMDRAQLKRELARHLRAAAAVYTGEEEWARNAHRTADRLEKEVEHLEYAARRN